MKQEKHLLEDRLKEVISERNRDNFIEENIKNKIEEHKIDTTEVTKIWKSPKLIKSVSSEILLYLITKYLYEETNDSSIDPKEYFTDAEINSGDDYKYLQQEEKMSYPLVFENVLKAKYDQYITIVPIQIIKQLLDDGMVTYNFDTQRNPKYKRDKDDSLIKVPNTNPKSVENIAVLIKKDKFITNTLSLNLLQNGEDKFVYNEKAKRLTIYSGQLNPADGWHRDKAIVRALLDNKNIELNMFLQITNWNVNRCKQFIEQEDHHNKIDKRYIDSEINIENWGNKVVVSLNQNDGDLKDKIASTLDAFRIKKAYALSGFMAKTINLLWQFDTTNDAYDLANYLTEFFNYLIGNKKEDFIKNLEQSREENIITYPTTFIGYLAIAHKVQGEHDWKNKVKDFLDNANFNINNKDWLEIGIIDKVSMKYAINLANVTRYRKIIEYFEKLI